jgi:hypothetical protein
VTTARRIRRAAGVLPRHRDDPAPTSSRTSGFCSRTQRRRRRHHRQPPTPSQLSTATAAASGESAVLVTFTDSTGRNRIAEVELTATWREDGCDHAPPAPGALGEECTDCGMVTAPAVVTARCPECHSPVTDETSCFGVHTASCGLVMCQCEHIDHEHPATAHLYLGVRAGTRRAQHVGLVCDECAAGHLAGYLLDDPTDEDGPR